MTKRKKNGKEKSNNILEVSIERIDKSITNDKGEVIAIIYYDKPVVSGDSEAAQKINAFFDNEAENWFQKNGEMTGFHKGCYDEFCNGMELMKERWGDDVLEESPCRYVVDTRIKYLDDNILSIFQVMNYRLEQCNWYYYGSTFDLSTGELLPITELTDITADNLRKVITDATYEGYYDELSGKNYEITFHEQKLDMRYEYFYDGANFYIIDNLGGYYRDGIIIEWNGEWDKSYEVLYFQYIVDWKTEKLTRKNDTAK